MTYIDTATQKTCSICKQSNTELCKSNIQVSSDHMYRHTSLIHTFLHNNYNMAEKYKRNVVNSVLKRIWKYGEKLNCKTVEDGMVTALRHDMGFDAIKDSGAEILGRNRLSNALSEEKYDDFHDSCNHIVRVVIDGMRKKQIVA